MSYTIEYNRIFLKSGEGITPCVLDGSSNCYEPSYNGRMRRDRSWGCFLNMIGVTEEAILKAVQPWLGGYQEHWMKNGKWVDDAGLIRWVRSGVQRAVTLEPLLEANQMAYVCCRVYTWTPETYTKDILSVNCRTTAELDAWIRQAKKVIQDRKAAGETAYPVISDLPENLRKPRVNTPDKAIVKKKGSYLVSHTDQETRWSRNAAEAEAIPWEDAEILLRQNLLLRKARLVDAARKEAPNNAVIQFKTGYRAGTYIARRSRSRIFTTSDVTSAIHYANEKAATDAMRKLQPAVEKIGELEVVIDA